MKTIHLKDIKKIDEKPCEIDFESLPESFEIR